ncbi:MAG: hypothetical protein J6Z79_06590 [Clostridia bacterium]|nr:hypothetical protein [Clostridia bacterium]
MKRVTLFCGHYGSGKTNIAINYTKSLIKRGLPVTIADLDVVNPYFRTKDSEAELIEAGAKVITMPFANSNVDLPSLPAEAYALVQDKIRYAVIDVGGDDRGALALGRYVPYILEENNYDMLCVVNFYRPLTTTPGEALEVLREVEAAAGLPFTGIVNNSNLGAETTREAIEASKDKAAALSKLAGIPVRFTSVRADLACGDEFPLDLQKKIFE